MPFPKIIMQLTINLLRRICSKQSKKSDVFFKNTLVSPSEGNPTQSEQAVRADRQIVESIEDLQKKTVDQFKTKK